MARRDDRHEPKPKEPSFGNDALKQALQKAAKSAPAVPAKATTAAPAPATKSTKRPPPPPPGRPKHAGPVTNAHDDDALFLSVMDDVAPVTHKKSQAPVATKPTPGAPAGPTMASIATRRRAEDAEALAQLAELVASPDTLVMRKGAQGLDAVAEGVDLALLEPLKKGEFGAAETVRFTDAATLERTLSTARRAGTRVVRVEGPVDVLSRLLTTGRLPKLVLAFAGRSTGLTGVVDVLLRR